MYKIQGGVPHNNKVMMLQSLQTVVDHEIQIFQNWPDGHVHASFDYLDWVYYEYFVDTKRDMRTERKHGRGQATKNRNFKKLYLLEKNFRELKLCLSFSSYSNYPKIIFSSESGKIKNPSPKDLRISLILSRNVSYDSAAHDTCMGISPFPFFISLGQR